MCCLWPFESPGSVFLNFFDISETGQVVSMLSEPKLETFYSRPKYDLKLNSDAEKKLEGNAEKIIWPDISLLFGLDLEYQKDIGQIMDLVKDSLEAAVVHKSVRLKHTPIFLDTVIKFI